MRRRVGDPQRTPPIGTGSARTFVTGALWAWALSAAPGLTAQAAVSLEATIEADSVVRVGEPFTVRLVVGQERAGEVRFPALVEVPEALEQTAPVQIRSIDDGREWQAEYTLVAWRADSIRIPPIEVELTGAGGVTRTLEPPVVVVRSVLPAEDAGLELRDARPFLRLRAFPWWLLLLAAAVAALVWWTWRRRGGEAAGPLAPAGPGDRALGELERLRMTWLDGRISGDRFYDDYEKALRRYARATRGWAPSRELIGLGERDSGLIAAFRHSVFARFARVRPEREGPIDDIDVGEAFVRSEMPTDEAEDGPTTTPDAEDGPTTAGDPESGAPEAAAIGEGTS